MDSGTVLLCRWRQIFLVAWKLQQKKNTFFFSLSHASKALWLFTLWSLKFEQYKPESGGRKLVILCYCCLVLLLSFCTFCVGFVHSRKKLSFLFLKPKIIWRILSISIWIDLIETTTLFPLSYVYIVVSTKKKQNLWTFRVVLPRNVLWDVFQVHF